MHKTNLKNALVSIYYWIANLDVVSSIFILITGFVIIYLSFSSGIGQYGMGFAFIAGASAYLHLRKYAQKNIEENDITNLENVSWDKSILLLLNSIFLLCFSASIYILYRSLYFRPPIYFILVTLAYFSIFIEVFYVDRKGILIYLNILKAILLSLSFRAGIYFEFPTVPGTDTQYHLKLANIISKIGHVPSYEIVQSNYVYTPLWHIFVSSTGTVLGIASSKIALLLSIALPFTIIISLFTFLIVREISDVKTGLIAVLFVNIADMLLVRGLENINTSSLVHCLFLLTLFSLMQERNKVAFCSFVILSIFDMIFTHQLSTFCVLIIFFSLLISRHIYNFLSVFLTFEGKKERKLTVDATVQTYFVVLLILRWSTMGNERSTFFDSMLYRLKSSILDMLTEYTSACSYVNVFRHFDIISNTLYNLGYSMLIGFAIIGFLLWLNRKHISQTRFSCLIATVILFIVIYPLTYVGLGHLFIPHRFISFLEIFLVMFAAYSVYILFYSQLISRTLLCLAVVALIFFMLTTPYVNRNDVIYCNEREYRTEWTYSEIISLLWAMNHTNDTIYKDILLEMRKIPTVVSVNLSGRDIRDYPADANVNGLVIVRSYFKEIGGKVYVSGTFGKMHEYDRSEFLNNVIKNNLVFSTGGVKTYIAC